MISEADAVARAEQAVKMSGVDPGDRRRSVAIRGEEYEVVFHAPPDMLAGDFTVLVDRASGAITSETFER